MHARTLGKLVGAHLLFPHQFPDAFANCLLCRQAPHLPRIYPRYGKVYGKFAEIIAIITAITLDFAEKCAIIYRKVKNPARATPRVAKNQKQRPLKQAAAGNYSKVEE